MRGLIMQKSINLLKQLRQILFKSLNSLSEKQLLIIPEGHNNNILWNIGHVVAVQQALQYRLSGLEMYISQDVYIAFQKGSSPKDWENTPNIKEIKSFLLELPEKLDYDFQAGKFREFSEYETSAGITLSNIEDAILFNNFHEGLHLGVIMSLKKCVQRSG